MKKDRVVKTSVAIIMLSLTVVGGSIAFFRAETQANNKMTSTQLEVALMEGNTESGFKKLNDDSVVLEDVSPGASIDRQLYIKNTKESPSYVRVTLTKYWETLDGEKLPDRLSDQISIMTRSDDWIVHEDENDENVYMYYRLPIESGEQTSAFMDQVQIAKDGSKLNNSYTNLNAMVDIEVDAIQEYAAKEAILSEWGLDVEFDGQGRISQVVE